MTEWNDLEGHNLHCVSHTTDSKGVKIIHPSKRLWQQNKPYATLAVSEEEEEDEVEVDYREIWVCIY